MMLTFYLAFEKLVEKWPHASTLSLNQIADLTKSSVARTVDAISASLNREFDVNESITIQEAKVAAASLKDRLSSQLDARDRRRILDREAAVRAYKMAREKVRAFLMQKDYRTAYRTLVYVMGQHDKNLPHEQLIALCGDCIRYGSRTDTSLAELGTWLRKAVNSAVQSGRPEAIEDALDFLDTYREVFSADKNGTGSKIVTGALAALTLPVGDIYLP